MPSLDLFSHHNPMASTCVTLANQNTFLLHIRKVLILPEMTLPLRNRLPLVLHCSSPVRTFKLFKNSVV